MPIAKVKLEDGRIARFNVPEGTTPDEVVEFASNFNFDEEQQTATKPVSQSARRPEKKEGIGRTALEQSLQGATFGLADEISNFVGAGIAAALTDEDFTDLLTEAQKRGEDRLARQQEQRPVLSVASQVGGGIATGVAGAATKTGKNILSSIGRSGTVGRVGKSTGVGAATGAVTGFGTGEGGVSERLEGAKTGAKVGGTVGGALPVVGNIAKNIVGGARRTGQLVTGRKADTIVTDALANKDLKSLQQTLDDGKSISSLVDIAGDEAKGLLRSVAKKSGGTKNYVADFLENRSEDSGRRINDLLSQKVSNIDNYYQNLDDLAKGRAVAAAPLYKKAYQEAAEIDRNKLNKLLQDKRIIDAVDIAKRDLGVRIEAPVNSLEVLDGAKKALDDIIGESVRAGKSQKAASFLKLKQQLVSELDQASPTYSKARQVFSGFKSIEDAQEQGLKFLSEDPELIRRTIKGLTAGEHDAYLIGVRRALKNQVDRTADAGDPAKRIFGNQLVRDKIKAAFPNKKGFNEFSKRMVEEIQAAETKFKVLGGSRSDFNLAQDAGMLLDLAEVGATQGSRGITAEIIGAVATGLKNRAVGLTDKNSKEIARILLDRDAGVEVLERFMKKQPALQQEVIKDLIPDFTTIRNQQAANVGISSAAAGGQ